MRTGQNEAIRERELTSGRSPAAIVIATLVILLCGYALLEAALKALGQDPLIATPETWWTWISLLPGDLNPFGLVASGLAAVLLGWCSLPMEPAEGGWPGTRWDATAQC